MVDQDWMDSSNPGTRTDESRHPDTQLNYANEFDLNIKGWLLNEQLPPGTHGRISGKPL